MEIGSKTYDIVNSEVDKICLRDGKNLETDKKNQKSKKWLNQEK